MTSLKPVKKQPKAVASKYPADAPWWSIKEAAEEWAHSISWVKKMLRMKRIPPETVQRIGGGQHRAGLITIKPQPPPAQVGVGKLSPEVRAMWPKKAKKDAVLEADLKKAERKLKRKPRAKKPPRPAPPTP